MLRFDKENKMCVIKKDVMPKGDYCVQIMINHSYIKHIS